MALSLTTGISDILYKTWGYPGFWDALTAGTIMEPASNLYGDVRVVRDVFDFTKVDDQANPINPLDGDVDSVALGAPLSGLEEGQVIYAGAYVIKETATAAQDVNLVIAQVVDGVIDSVVDLTDPATPLPAGAPIELDVLGSKQFSFSYVFTVPYDRNSYFGLRRILGSDSLDDVKVGVFGLLSSNS
jgi:hypothetical protein